MKLKSKKLKPPLTFGELLRKKAWQGYCAKKRGRKKHPLNFNYE